MLYPLLPEDISTTSVPVIFPEGTKLHTQEALKEAFNSPETGSFVVFDDECRKGTLIRKSDRFGDFQYDLYLFDTKKKRFGLKLNIPNIFDNDPFADKEELRVKDIALDQRFNGRSILALDINATADEKTFILSTNPAMSCSVR